MVRAFLLAAILPAAVAAQAPNLDATIRTEGGHAWVVLRNLSRTAAVAYNCVVASPATGKRKATSQWITQDELFDPPGTVRVEPGGQREIPVTPVRPPAQLNVRAAVLYEDGSTSGEPDDARRLLDVRHATLEDIPAIQNLIRSSSDVGGLRLELEKLRKRNLKAPAPVLKHGTPRDDKRKARELVRLHYAGSQLPAVVLGWLNDTSDKPELLSRIDALRDQIMKSPQ